jgi:hypothetical protein
MIMANNDWNSDGEIIFDLPPPSIDLACSTTMSTEMVRSRQKPVQCSRLESWGGIPFKVAGDVAGASAVAGNLGITKGR